MNTAAHSVPALDPTAVACREALLEVLQLGVALTRQVCGDAGPQKHVDRATAYERVTRAMRRTVRMIQWLGEPKPVRRAAGDERVAARSRILRAVEDRIDVAAEPEEAESLHVEALERLDSLEFESDIGRPAGEVIGEICRDLGMGLEGDKHAPLRRRLADIAALYARAAAAPGSMSDVVAPELPLAKGERPPPPEIDVSKLTDEELDALESDPPDPSWRTEHYYYKHPPDPPDG